MKNQILNSVSMILLAAAVLLLGIGVINQNNRLKKIEAEIEECKQP